MASYRKREGNLKKDILDIRSVVLSPPLTLTYRQISRVILHYKMKMIFRTILILLASIHVNTLIVSGWIPPQTASQSIGNRPCPRNHRIASPSSLNSSRLSSSGRQSKNKKKPKLIIFDLDGCLWAPEKYELLYFSGGKGAPFTTDPTNPHRLRTVGGESVR